MLFRTNNLLSTVFYPHDNSMTISTPAAAPSSSSGYPTTPPSGSPSPLSPLYTSPSTSNTRPTTHNVAPKDMSRCSPPRTGGSPIHSTPIKCKLSGSHSYNSQSLSRTEAKARLVAETRGHYIGPIPPTVFLEDFLSWKKKIPARPQCKSIFNGVPVNRTENAMFNVLVCTSRCIILSLLLTM